MVQRLKDLLDQAAAGVEPRATSPVTDVIRRGRIAHAKSVVAGALVVLAVLTAGTVAGARLAESAPMPQTGQTAPAPVGSSAPPGPLEDIHLENGRVHVRDMNVAVPEGWAAEPILSATCGLHSGTVLFGEAGNPWGPSIYCSTGEIDVLRVYGVFPWVWELTGPDPGAPDAYQKAPVVPYRMKTLSGGAAVWLRTDPDGSHRIVVPWSRAEVTVRGGAEVRQRILDSLAAGPWDGAALVLPKQATWASLTMTTAGGKAREVKLADRAKVQRALQLLREAPVVERGGSCASEGQPTVAIEIGREPVVDLSGDLLGSLVIGLAPGCHEVVSEEGGRVRLDPADIEELGDLFGVRLP